MRSRFAVFAAILAMAPLGAQAADLVVWWDKGFYPQEDEAVRDIITAFEQDSGKQVELVQAAQNEIVPKAQAAIDAGQPPDFLFATMSSLRIAQWAYEDRLVNLEGVLQPVLNLFDADAIEVSTLLNSKTGRRGLYALPMARYSNNIHVWNSLLERAGLSLENVPKGWEAFWSFWCDQVQPAVRRATGRNDLWGVGLAMSAAASDTDESLLQFELAYGTLWLDGDRRSHLDDPAVRAGLIKALDAYTLIWRKGCLPPDSVSWDNRSNNKAFLAQTVVMTLNTSLSIPAALRRAGPEDYPRNTATIEWPAGADGQPLAIVFRRWPSRLGGTLRSRPTSCASSPRKAGWPIGSISGAIVSCRRCASRSISPSGSILAIRTVCGRPSRS